MPELVVRAGTSGTARLEVNRAGHAGDAVVTIAAPSDPGLTATADPIAGDTRVGTVVVTAADSLGSSETAASLQVTVTLDGMTAQENLAVRVPQFEPPTFTPQERCVLQPGRTNTVVLGVDRKGYPGRPIEIREPGSGGDGQPTTPPADAPREIVCVPGTVAAGDEISSLELMVDAGAADGPRTVVLSGSTMAREFPVTFQVDVLARPYAVRPPNAVTVAPGSSLTLPLDVTRTAYAGPIAGVVANLPPGVSAEPLAIGPGADTAALVLTASRDAEPRVRSAALRTTGGPFAVEEVLVVRVQRPGEEGALPAALVAGADGARLRKPGPMTGRLSADAKRALADCYGGTPESQAAVARGLAWLAKVQQPDGMWTLKGGDAPAAADAPADPEPPADPTLATALALLPFLGEGVSHQRAPAEPADYQTFKTAVQNGLVFLCANQIRERGKADGYLRGSILGHALATLALAEDYALSRDERLKPHIRQAVKFLGGIQNQDGSWGPEPGGAGDLPTTCRVVQALRAVQAAGLGASAKSLNKARQFVGACAAGPDDAPASRYRAAAARPASPLATAAGLVAQLELGGSEVEADLRAGGRFLLETAPAARGVPPMPYLCLATEALRSLGGSDFDAWNHAAREYLVRRQRVDGDLQGSWDPDGAAGGRMEATALALVTLEVYHRRLPPDRGAAKAADDAERESADQDRGTGDSP